MQDYLVHVDACVQRLEFEIYLMSIQLPVAAVIT